MSAKALAAVAALLVWAAPLAADQRDPRLPGLFEELSAAPDTRAALLAEREIWRIWIASGDARVDRQMQAGMAAMAAGRLGPAIDAFEHASRLAPGFAEAWNKLATAHYLAGAFEDSMREIQRTLALEPRHFGAISGIGLILLARGDERGALRAFERVLTIHPRAPGALQQVERLRRRSGERPV